jgi:hypothetical protein
VLYADYKNEYANIAKQIESELDALAAEAV